MLPPGSGTKTMCLFHPEPWLHHHELPAELSSEHATQHPVPILPLLGRAVRQHVPLKMMHGFVMHQRENIKEFNSCTELCGDCIRFVWKVHNTSHMQQEHNSVCSIHLCRRTPFLRGPWLSILQQGMLGACEVGKANQGALQFSPRPTKQRLFIPKPCELPWSEKLFMSFACTGCAAPRLHTTHAEC